MSDPALLYQPSNVSPEALRALDERCFPQEPMPRDDIAAILHADLWAASGDDRLVAYSYMKVTRDLAWIARVAVAPEERNKGIGTRLMQEIERAFDQAERFELFTGHRSERNLYLYQKLGYEPFRQQTLTDRVTLVFLEKTITPVTE